MGIKIKGTGSYTPEKILTNFDLEKMVDTSDEWIRTRTGISERHIASAEQATSDLAFNAAQKALEMAEITGADLDLIVVASITPDYVFPSTGCVLQSKLGAAKAFCFDIEAACSGLLYSMEVANSLMKANPDKYRKALIVGAEKLSSITNWEDRNTCVLFGDGAGAIVLENDGLDDESFLLASDLHSDGNSTDILIMPAGGSRHPASNETLATKMHYIHMAGKEVFKLAVNGMISSCNKVIADAGIALEKIKLVVPHQANYRILSAVAERLGITDDKMYLNVNRYGNTSAASIGLCMDEIVRGGLISRGDYVLFTAFGGGLTWGAILAKF